MNEKSTQPGKMINKQIEKLHNQKKQGYEVAKIMDFGYLKIFYTT